MKLTNIIPFIITALLFNGHKTLIRDYPNPEKTPAKNI